MRTPPMIRRVRQSAGATGRGAGERRHANAQPGEVSYEGHVLARTMIRVKPGKPPHVRKEHDSITIVMDVAPSTSQSPIRLVLRCERDGQIYASIDRGPHSKTE
jgi:hypothetical protein